MRIPSWSPGCSISGLSRESLFKTIQVIGHSFCREVIHHISFTAGCSTFYLLECFSHESGNQTPLSFRSFPYQLSVFYLRRQVIATHCFLFLRSRSVCQNPESHQPTQFGIRTLFFIRHFYGCFQAFAAFQCVFFNQ